MLNEIVERWKEIVHQYPNQNAVFYKGVFWSYAEIDRMSDYYANLLNSKSEKVIGVMMGNSDIYVIVLLAIIKCGYTFVPIDKDYPKERVQYIVNDCKIDTVVMDSDKYEVEVSRKIVINNLDKEIFNNDGFSYADMGEVAYILYTSGTTGVPKGIRISGKSLINLVSWFEQTYSIRKNLNVLQLASICFDVSIEEIFGCILNGGTLYIPQKEERIHYRKLRKYISENRINIIQAVPIVLKELLLNGDEYFEDLKVVISGGEALGEYLKDQILSKGYSLYNHYGPTETTVDCLTSKCEIGKRVAIGRPIKNCDCFIIDEEFNVVQDGVWGELCCSGINLALGYTNCKDDTHKFIYINGIRSYRTGDWCCKDTDGEFIYGERMDNMVKIKGRRIELGEISSTIMQMKEIYNCISIVIDDDFGGKIISFYNSISKIENNVFDKFLREKLPSYMIPFDYVFIDKFEMSANSKLDIGALKEIYSDCKRNTIKKADVESEERIQEVKDIIEEISEILRIPEYEIWKGSKFEDLGMDSISFVSLIVKLEERYDLEVEDDMLGMDVFNNIEQLGDYIFNLRRKGN